MQGFYHLLASIAFAAHALLGCGVHHMCCVEMPRPSSDCPWHDECPMGHVEHSQPAKSPHSHHDSCQHVACSFMKAEPSRIELDVRAVPNLLSWPTSAACPAELASRAVCEPVVGALGTTLQLYVWHCALLI